jgi:hypothetical protein
MERRFNKLICGTRRVNNEGKLTPEIRDAIVNRNSVLIIGTRLPVTVRDAITARDAQPGMRPT